MQLGVALPFWLDRADEEAIEIALSAEAARIESLWVGETGSFDAFALATAIGLRTERVRLKIGPLAVGVRSPVEIALGVSSVATLIGRHVDLALGSSSPAIVSGWHGREWTGMPARMRETLATVRAVLAGERIASADGHMPAQGFRLRRPQPRTSVTVAAFGPVMTRVAAESADEVVLNLVSPEHVAEVRMRIDELAIAAGRPPPRLAVWVPAALNPRAAARAQLADQLAIYLAAPGYREAFTRLGFGELVAKARAGTRRAALAAEVPLEFIRQIGMLGSELEIKQRIAAYHRAGADHVAIVPSTAGDPGGRNVLEAVSGYWRSRRESAARP
jgi:probable F420-dependent oxidoreductase